MRLSPGRQYAIAAAAAGMATLACTVADGYMSVAGLALVYLLAVVATAVLLERGPGVAASLLCVSALNFFFVPPRYSFEIDGAEYWWTLAVLLALSVWINGLVASLRARRAKAEEASAQAAWSGLLLLLGEWERSHEISQDNSSPEGSYWHAIAHRIEPDSSNAGYWFRRVGIHPIFVDLHEKTATILATHDPNGWRLKATWDPILFITWCEEARKGPGTPAERAALEIQQAEWRLLFEWCALNANDLRRRPK